MGGFPRWFLGSVFVVMALMASAQTSLFNAEGYRSGHYRAPLPAEVDGATTLDAAALNGLLKGGSSPKLLDVLSLTVRPELADFGVHWLPTEPRLHIEGSVWLPNVGFGELDETMTAFFQRELERVTEGDKNAPIVFYCVQDCWMSWNAARRAAQFGYTQLYWFPSGTDGWRAAGYPLVKGEPVQLESLD